MFSGKTEELIRRLKRAKIADQSIEIFKPARDTRYSTNDVVSHDAHVISSRPVNSSEEILSVDPAVQVIGIDEAQFFDEKLPTVCEELADRGHRVIVAGLDMDFRGRPFGPCRTCLQWQNMSQNFTPFVIIAAILPPILTVSATILKQ
jgi:thymidine kinase